MCQLNTLEALLICFALFANPFYTITNKVHILPSQLQTWLQCFPCDLSGSPKSQKWKCSGFSWWPYAQLFYYPHTFFMYLFFFHPSAPDLSFLFGGIVTCSWIKYRQPGLGGNWKGAQVATCIKLHVANYSVVSCVRSLFYCILKW